MPAEPEAERGFVAWRRFWKTQSLVLGGLLAAALICAPLSCQGGLEAYALIGLTALAGSPVLAFRLAHGGSSALRLAVAASAFFTSLLMFVASFLLAPFQLLCRLF